MTARLSTLARETEAYVPKLREELHRIPELRFEEEQTLAVVQREVEAHAAASSRRPKIEIREYRGGMVVDLTVDAAAERWLLRADVDGLLVPEQTGLPYASVNPGRMHACGHDAHTAMLINTASEVEQVGRLLRAAGLETVEDDMRFGGEDFAWYLQARPGCFWFRGAQVDGPADHHAPRFNPDPTVFWRGVHSWLILATASAFGDRA